MTVGYHSRTGDESGATGSRRSTSSSSRCTASPISVAARPVSPDADRPLRPQACDPLGVVAVRAALVQRERRVRQPPHPVQRRRVGHEELGQPVAARRRSRRDRQLGEQLELPAPPSPVVQPRPESSSRSDSSSLAPVDVQQEPRVAALELDRLGSALDLRLRAEPVDSTQPIGVSRSCGRSGSIAPETISRSTARVIAT